MFSCAVWDADNIVHKHTSYNKRPGHLDTVPPTGRELTKYPQGRWAIGRPQDGACQASNRANTNRDKSTSD